MNPVAPMRRRAFLLAAPFWCVGLPGCGGCRRGRLSRRNLDQVEVGMTEDEVVGLLGPPVDALGSAGEAAGKKTMLWTAEDGEQGAVVFFENGKVVRKGSKGL